MPSRLIERYDGDIHEFTLLKDDETYVFRFIWEQRAEMLRTLGRFASNQELGIDWYDAAMITQNIPPDQPTELPSIIEQRARQTQLR